MSDIAIRVENLSKAYRIGLKEQQHETLLAAAAAWLKSPFTNFRSLQNLSTKDTQISEPRSSNSDLRSPISSSPPAQEDIFWALRDVSFEVKHGDAIGIIGRNGAGKSTLLKILSRITEPTSGRARIYGRVASLLEVGTGFHPDLTGRENVYLNGTILGMRRREIDAKFDEIVSFSGVEKFIDTPVKRYSSGMRVRLAFAVAAHLDPEILIIDEVLAVGDAEFQKKCLGKMQDVASQGRTVLFVSHNMQAVSTLTNRCIMLKNGSSQAHGPTSEIISRYLEDGISTEPIYHAAASSNQPCVTRAEVQTSEPNNVHLHGRSLRLVFEVTVPEPLKSAAFSFQIVDSLQQPVIHLWIYGEERPILKTKGVHRFVCDIPKLRLYLGRYTLSVHLAEGEGGKHFQTIEGLCPMEVVMYGMDSSWKWRPDTCKYLEEASWEVNGFNMAPRNEA